jgi:hypothetical protein
MTASDPGAANHPSDLNTLLDTVRNLSRETRELAEHPSPGTELTVAANTTPEAIKTTIAARRSALSRASKQLQEARDQLEQRVRREMAAVEDALRPMRKAVERMEELVWTVNLYLGRDEQLVTLLDGDPAPAHTPISVRQMVLSMDEETTIAAESGGIDFRDVESFDRWVSQSANLQRVLPEPRGVVVLVPRRRGRDYGEPMLNSVLNSENKRSYWLIRNGARLFRMSTDFTVGDLLTPARHEFESYFTEFRYSTDTRSSERVPLEPGSAAWLRAEEQADARRRHYMRAALILQGLVDRTTVFAPLPAERVSLLDPASYDAGHVQLVCDAENTLTTGRTPFYQWLAERNRQLRPGMRIIGAFNLGVFTSLRSRERWDYDKHERLWPQRAENPPASTPHVIDERTADGGFLFRYARTEEVRSRGPYGGTEYRSPKTRASCVIYPDDLFILPIDLVTIEEMRDYLDARSERHAYLEMLPLLKSAIAAKEAEVEQERPFRELLAAQIVLAHDVDHVEAESAVGDLVTWWKHTTKHYRPLVAAAHRALERRAVREIVAEFAAARAASAQAAREAFRDTAAVEQLRTLVPDAMIIARTRAGGYVVLAPQPRSYPAPLARTGVWVREYTAGKTVRNLHQEDWVLPTQARLDKWIVLWQADAWTDWNLAASRADNLTDPEIGALLVMLRDAGVAHMHDAYDDTAQRRLRRRTGVPAVIACDHEKGRPGLHMYFDGGDTYDTPERLLTGTIPLAAMLVVGATWRRGQGNTVRITVEDNPCWRQWGMYHHGPDGDISPPWERQTLLWADEGAVERYRAQAVGRRADLNRAAALRDTAMDAYRVVVDAWEKRAEDAAYQRFLDDYRDPELWEGHRKTILRKLNYPHRSSHQDSLHHLLCRVVEDGHDLAGHTVATAASLLGENLSLPADILHLPVALDPST